MYVVGEERDLLDLASAGESQDILASLRTYGIKKFRKSSSPPEEMAAQSIRKTLEASGTDPRRVGMVVYATETYWHSDYLARAIGKMLSKVGMAHAYPIGFYGSACGNMVPALENALDLLATGKEEHILLVTVDAERPGCSRVIDPPVSVSSDGAASCLLTRSPGRGFLIRKLSRGVHKFSGSTDAGPQGLGMLQDTQSALRRFFGRHLEGLGLSPGDYERVITHNYIHPTLKLYAMTMGFSSRQLFLENVGRMAHLSLNDCLVNLADCCSMHPPVPGQRYLLMGNGLNPGLSMWGFATLEAV